MRLLGLQNVPNSKVFNVHAFCELYTEIILFREGGLLFIMVLKGVMLLMIQSLKHCWTKDVILTLKMR